MRARKKKYAHCNHYYYSFIDITYNNHGEIILALKLGV